MRQALRNIWALAFLIPIIASGSGSDHLSFLRSKFPDGLLGNDYGILTLNDLALNACYFKPEPFALDFETPYEYWQCFESKFISAQCEDSGVLEGEGRVGWIVVKAYTDQSRREHIEYIERRPWSLRGCRDFARSMTKLMRGTSHACISASEFGYVTEESGKKELIGFLGRFKNRKGCDGEECEFSAKVQKEYCPDLKL
jgi:hypothetical protein